MRKLLILLSVVGPLLSFALLGPPVKAQPATPPTVVAVTPDTGQSDEQTAVTIAGQDFVATSEAYLDGIPLVDVVFVDSTKLLARIPFGVPTGAYTLTVTNPLPGILTQCFTVTESVDRMGQRRALRRCHT